MRTTRFRIVLLCALGCASACNATVPDSNPAGSSPQGQTPKEIHDRFATIIEHNFNTSTANLVDRLHDDELASLAERYADATGGQTAPLLDRMASTLPAGSLTRVAQAFGYKATAAAVARKAPPQVAGEFLAAMAGSDAAAVSGPQRAAPTVDMTINEVYLEFRTAPVGSLSVSGALAETAMFVGGRLAFAYSTGYAVGTGIRWLLENYAPSVDNAIGAGVASVVDSLSRATDYVEQGQLEQDLDGLFGSPIESSGDYSGDWDVSDAMDAVIGDDCLIDECE
jgi:hypothetical protein